MKTLNKILLLSLSFLSLNQIFTMEKIIDLGNEKDIENVIFSADDRWVAVETKNGKAIIFDLKKKKKVKMPVSIGSREYFRIGQFYKEKNQTCCAIYNLKKKKTYEYVINGNVKEPFFKKHLLLFTDSYRYKIISNTKKTNLIFEKTNCLKGFISTLLKIHKSFFANIDEKESHKRYHNKRLITLPNIPKLYNLYKKYNVLAISSSLKLIASIGRNNKIRIIKINEFIDKDFRERLNYLIKLEAN